MTVQLTIAGVGSKTHTNSHRKDSQSVTCAAGRKSDSETLSPEYSQFIGYTSNYESIEPIDVPEVYLEEVVRLLHQAV